MEENQNQIDRWRRPRIIEDEDDDTKDYLEESTSRNTYQLEQLLE